MAWMALRGLMQVNLEPVILMYVKLEPVGLESTRPRLRGPAPSRKPAA